MLIKDDIFMDFAITGSDSSRSILGRKSISYRDYVLNQPLSDTLFGGAVALIRPRGVETKDERFWSESRHDTLNKRERGVYKTVDSLNNYRPFRRFMSGLRLVLEGYTPVGMFDVGPANAFYSFNDIEGFRGRLGGLTNYKFSQDLILDGYAAYGFSDKKWKGYAGARYSLHGNAGRFPFNQFKAWYTNEIKIPGQELQFVTEDNFLLSFKRGVNNKMIYNRTIGLEYIFENANNGWSFSSSIKNTELSPAGILNFEYQKDDVTAQKPFLTTSEIGVMLRYAPNQQFYQGINFRVPILNRYPIVEFMYSKGFKGVLNSEFDNHTLSLKAEKIFYISPFGWADVIVEGGRVFGQVPYPLLVAHRANQTYSYQMESFNLMNFLEFVSDKYASINIYYNMNGLIFNRIPLIKKLKWREAFTFKSIWGGVDADNLPNSTNGLLKFPTDENNKTITYTLEKEPYIEASVGISNIFRFVRVDYVRRLTYLNHPGISQDGIRARIKVDF
jgi:hypothetical protein